MTMHSSSDEEEDRCESRVHVTLLVRKQVEQSDELIVTITFVLLGKYIL